MKLIVALVFTTLIISVSTRLGDRNNNRAAERAENKAAEDAETVRDSFFNDVQSMIWLTRRVHLNLSNWAKNNIWSNEGGYVMSAFRQSGKSAFFFDTVNFANNLSANSWAIINQEINQEAEEKRKKEERKANARAGYGPFDPRDYSPEKYLMRRYAAEYPGQPFRPERVEQMLIELSEIAMTDRERFFQLIE